MTYSLSQKNIKNTHKTLKKPHRNTIKSLLIALEITYKSLIKHVKHNLKQQLKPKQNPKHKQIQNSPEQKNFLHTENSPILQSKHKQKKQVSLPAEHSKGKK